MDVPTEILSIANQYLRKVRRSGSENIMAICPFHQGTAGGEEKHPSFAMSLTKGVYFCHACHTKGTLYTFLKELGLDRPHIQMRYGLVIDEAAKNLPTPQDPLRPQDLWVEEHAAIEEGVLGLFDHDVSQLLPLFNPDVLKYFEVGWDGWHHRVTYPIRDVGGHLVGISGRAVYEEQKPKYKIYDEEYRCWRMPPRTGWNKRSVLWNSHRVYPELYFNTLNPTLTYLILVEGFKAGMWMHQSGITNVVALLGSYLSWEQQWLLVKIGVPVYMFLDNDDAGWKGQLDAAYRLEECGLWVRLIEYPERLRFDEKAQPDRLSVEEVHEQVARAPRLQEWKLRH